MLSAKPWKLDAIVRLLLGALVCFICGSLLFILAHHRPHPGTAFYLASAGALVCLAASVMLMHLEWRFEDFTRRMVLLLVCFCCGLVLAAFAQQKAGPPPTSATGELIIFVEPCLVLLLVLFVREHRISWREGFGLANRPAYSAWLGFSMACVIIPVALSLQWCSAELMSRVHVKPVEQEVVQTFRASSAWVSRASLGVVAVMLAPVVEETFFRGILYPAIKQTGFPRLALWGAALLFACLHFNAASFVPLLLLAVALTLLYEYTNNLLAAVTTHATFNAVNFVLLWWSDVRPIPLLAGLLGVGLVSMLAAFALPPKQLES